VKDDAERMAMSGSNEAHAVAHRHPVEAAHPTHRALMHWKNNRVAAPERNNFGPRLPPPIRGYLSAGIAWSYNALRPTIVHSVTCFSFGSALTAIAESH
jgi:hypothetical protein